MNRPRQDIDARLDELESRLAFQDDLIESLNEVIARQDRDLSRMAQQLKDLSTKISDLSESGAAPSHPADHEIPPHY